MNESFERNSPVALGAIRVWHGITAVRERSLKKKGYCFLIRYLPLTGYRAINIQSRFGKYKVFWKSGT